MEPDRPSIERSDFSKARRGYDPAEVDGHLRSIADMVERLQEQLDERDRRLSESSPSLSTTAADRVRAIIDAAEKSADELRRNAEEDAHAQRSEAQDRARILVEETEREARAREEEVRERTTALLERADALDAEFERLLERMRSAAEHVIEELRSEVREIEDGLELAGSAAEEGGATGEEVDRSEAQLLAQETRTERRGGAESPEPDLLLEDEGAEEEAAGYEPAPMEEAAPARGEAGRAPEPAGTAEERPIATEEAAAGVDDVAEMPGPAAEDLESESAEPPGQSGARRASRSRSRASAREPQASGDTEGARLIALNMALSGTPRADTAEYLRETFGLEDEELLDEVYRRVEAR